MNNENCPFCNSINTNMKFEVLLLSSGREYYIECENCGARGPTKKVPIDARKAWRKAIKPSEVICASGPKDMHKDDCHLCDFSDMCPDVESDGCK